MRLRPRDQLEYDLSLYRQRMYEIGLRRGLDPMEASKFAAEQTARQCGERARQLQILQEQKKQKRRPPEQT